MEKAIGSVILLKSHYWAELVKMSDKEFKANFTLYLEGREKKTWAWGLYFEYMTETFDVKSGACDKPPSRLDKYKDVPEWLKPTLASQDK